MDPGWCATSVVTSLFGQKSNAMANLLTVQRLLNFSWDRDVVDMKGCLRTYQENEINVVPSTYNSMW